MKAKEYFARLDGISPEDLKRMASGSDEEFTRCEFSDIVMRILVDLIKEGSAVMKERRVQSDAAAISVIKEMRDKWEAICRMIAQKYGKELFDRQTFNRCLKMMLPNLANMLPPDFWR